MIYNRALEQPTDFILNEESYFSIVVPENSINLVQNPEVSTLDGYTSNSLITLDNSEQAYGLNSIFAQMQQGQEIRYNMPTALVAGQVYTFSVATKGEAEIELYIRNGGAIVTSTSKYNSKPFWNRYALTFKPNVALATAQLCVRLVNYRANLFLDGFQLEPKGYATTFISGNRRTFFENETPTPYYWTGSPNNSESVRLNSTRAGGRIISLSDIGVNVVGFEGLGMPDFEHAAQPLALQNKSYYQNSTIQSRGFTILATIDAKNRQELLTARNRLAQYLTPNINRKQQPVRLLFQLKDCNEPIGKCIEIDSVYNGGLEGSFNNMISDRFAIEFIMFDPLVKSCIEHTCNLGAYDTVESTADPGFVFEPVFTNANNSGKWFEINQRYAPASLGIVVNDLFVGTDNFLYAAGNFRFGGTNYIAAKWNGNAWEPLGPGGDLGSATSGVVGPDNSIYFGGTFSQVGGVTAIYVPGSLNIIKYNIDTNTYEYIGEVEDTINDVAISDDGILSLAGRFDQVRNAGGTAFNVTGIATFNTVNQNWDDLNGGPIAGPMSNIFGVGPVMNATAIDKQGNIWVGGNFSLGGFDQNIAYINKNKTNGAWQYPDGLTWSAAHSATIGGFANDNEDTEVNAILVTEANEIYVAGRFNSKQTIEAALGDLNRLDRPQSITKFDGTFSWESMQAALLDTNSSGISNVPARLFDLAYDEFNDELYVAGEITYAGQQFLPPYDINENPYLNNLRNNGNGVFIWNSSQWRQLELNVDIPNFVDRAPVIALGKTFGTGTFTTNVDPTNQAYDTGLAPGVSNSVFVAYEGGLASHVSAKFPTTVICDTACSDIASPIITIVGPGKPIFISNDKGGRITFNNKVLEENEVLTIDLSKIIPTVRSNLYGDQRSVINSSSSLNSFKLYPGENTIRTLAIESDAHPNTSPNVYITYKPSYLSIDAASNECN